MEVGMRVGVEAWVGGAVGATWATGVVGSGGGAGLNSATRSTSTNPLKLKRTANRVILLSVCTGEFVAPRSVI